MEHFIAEIVTSPLLGPIITGVVVIVTIYYTQKAHEKSIKELTDILKNHSTKSDELEKKIFVLEKDTAVLKTEVDGVSSKLMLEITNLKEVIQSLRDQLCRIQS